MFCLDMAVISASDEASFSHNSVCKFRAAYASLCTETLIHGCRFCLGGFADNAAQL